LVINSISTCFGHLYAHHQEVRLLLTAYGFLSCCSFRDAGFSTITTATTGQKTIGS